MAFFAGKDGVVKVGASAVEVGEVQSWTLDLAASIGEGWGMGDAAVRHFVSAPPTGSGSLEMYLDPADAGQALLVPAAEVAVELYPGGEAVGSGYFTLSAIIESVNRQGEKSGIPMLTVNFKVNGAVTPATVPTP